MCILLTTRLEGKVGNMWEIDSSLTDQWITKYTTYSEYMTHMRFKDARTYTSFVFADSKLEKSDVWWQVVGGGGINGFNENRHNVV